MNIREIAKLAGVSISTVSKVMNKKDQAISEETRQKVLSVMKENHYQAYSGSRFPMRPHSFLLGAILYKRPGMDAFLEALMRTASQAGYSVIARFAETPQEEQNCVDTLKGYPLDGVVVCRVQGSDLDPEKCFDSIPSCTLDLSKRLSPSLPGIDFEQLGKEATETLIKRRHRGIFCVVHGHSEEEDLFVEGFQKALAKNHLPFAAAQVCRYDGRGLPTKLLLENTAALCYDVDLAGKVYQEAFRKNRRIPRYLSVLSLAERKVSGFLPSLANYLLPFEELAEQACRRVIQQIEDPSAPAAPWESPVPQLEEGGSLALPSNERGQKLVVVGSINMDTTIALDKFPRIGQTAISNSRMLCPGGKGLNQAVAVAKLEGFPVLIGKVGRDYAGSEVWDHLQSSGVNVEYVRRTSRDSTGTAYICVQEDGESGIMVYKGANALLTSEEMRDSKSAFDGAEYCLLSTELDLDVIETAAQIAWERKVKLIVKPAALDRVEDSLLEKTEIFLPNERESALLCPDGKSYEEQAAFFLKKGAKQVIVTLGHKGCYWTDGSRSELFPAADFETVETTGAADAFIAALAVCLTKGLEIREAIRRATVAAGFSTTKWGVTDAMIDRDTLEFLCSARR